ncbi:hypothetical protein ACOME3_010290 [Neoechinorhynchus agilis]
MGRFQSRPQPYAPQYSQPPPDTEFGPPGGQYNGGYQPYGGTNAYQPTGGLGGYPYGGGPGTYLPTGQPNAHPHSGGASGHPYNAIPSQYPIGAGVSAPPHTGGLGGYSPVSGLNGYPHPGGYVSFVTPNGFVCNAPTSGSGMIPYGPPSGVGMTSISTPSFAGGIPPGLSSYGMGVPMATSPVVQPIPAGPPIWVGKVGDPNLSTSLAPSFYGHSSMLPTISSHHSGFNSSSPIVMPSSPQFPFIQPITPLMKVKNHSGRCRTPVESSRTKSSAKGFEKYINEHEHPVNIRIIDQRSVPRIANGRRSPRDHDGREISYLRNVNKSLIRQNERLIAELRRITELIDRHEHRLISKRRRYEHDENHILTLRDKGHEIVKPNELRTYGKLPLSENNGHSVR